jgi:hypothetical protein
MSILTKRINEGLEGKFQGLANGFKDLNKYTFGVQRGTYYLIGGSSGTYKTTLLDYIVRNAMKSASDNNIECNVFYYSFEIDKLTKMCNWVSSFAYQLHGVVIPPEKIKGLGEGTQKLMNVGETQLMLPEGTSTQMLAEQKAAEKIAHEKALKEAGMERSTSAAEASKVRADRLAEIEKLKSTSGAKAAAQLDKLKEILSVPQKYLTKAGEVMNIATSPLTTNLALRGLAGFGAGMSGDEAIQRLQKGQKGRAIISGLGAAGDIAAMTRHPAAMALGTAAGIGAPMLNAYLDKWAKENPDLAEKLGLKAGGLVNF